MLSRMLILLSLIATMPFFSLGCSNARQESLAKSNVNKKKKSAHIPKFQSGKVIEMRVTEVNNYRSQYDGHIGEMLIDTIGAIGGYHVGLGYDGASITSIEPFVRIRVVAEGESLGGLFKNRTHREVIFTSDHLDRNYAIKIPTTFLNKKLSQIERRFKKIDHAYLEIVPLEDDVLVNDSNGKIRKIYLVKAGQTMRLKDSFVIHTGGIKFQGKIN